MNARIPGFIVSLVVLAGGAVAQSLPNWSTPILGNVRGAVFGGRDAAVILAVRDGLDPVRSLDGGATWMPFTVQGTRPDRLVASPTDSKVFYALRGGAATGVAFNTSKSALYRTDDAGASWYLIHALLAPGVALGDLTVGAHPDLLYATRVDATVCSIGCSYAPGFDAYASFDAGRSWHSVAGEQRIGGSIHASAADAGVVYAAMGLDVYRSTDAGGSWRKVTPPIHSVVSQQTAFYYPARIAVDRVDPMILYARMTHGTELWVSGDGGETWTRRAGPNVPSPHRHFFVDPLATGRLYFMGEEGELFESRDRAGHWMQVAPRHDGQLSGASLTNTSWNGASAASEVAMNGGLRTVLAIAGDYRPTLGGTTLHRIEVANDSMALGSDLWWNPAQSGAGLTMTQHASGQVFLVWYRYDGNGNPVWQVMPRVTWSDARAFSGELLEARGPAYFQGPFDLSRVSTSAVGSATVRFTDGSNAIFSYGLDDGSAGEFAITRQLFGPPNDWRPNYVPDLWWNSAESGWGLAVSQQFGKVFACWYVYDANGRPLWVALPDGALDSNVAFLTGVQRYRGDLYTTRGPPFAAWFDPSRVEVTKVGTATITFVNRDRITFSYTAFGKTETKDLTRQPF